MKSIISGVGRKTENKYSVGEEIIHLKYEYFSEKLEITYMSKNNNKGWLQNLFYIDLMEYYAAIKFCCRIIFILFINIGKCQQLLNRTNSIMAYHFNEKHVNLKRIIHTKKSLEEYI